ncbi:hypothetical protein BVG81_006090 [Haliangium sp. UPWRP_2]|nr:hypothetical protein BVG81_006090 [Haliangium sp. UPWRP_2]
MTTLLGMFLTGCTTGTVRKDAKLYEPEFLTPKLKKQNMLGNASFEDANSLAWSVNKKSCRIIQFKSKDGVLTSCAEIDSPEYDDTGFSQTVQVKPHTKYLFSGWAKWQDVSIDMTEKTPRSKLGVNLCVVGWDEHSGYILDGTRDWTYLTCVFDSGDRTTLTVVARLGFWNSTAKGKAWFDDMCLVELPSLETKNK